MDAILALVLFGLSLLFTYLAIYGHQYFYVFAFITLISIVTQSYASGFSWHDAGNVTSTYSFVGNTSVVASVNELQAPIQLDASLATAFNLLALLMSMFYLWLSIKGGNPNQG